MSLPGSPLPAAMPGVADEGGMTLATRVAFLSRPGSYPERPDSVEAIETRLSWVFLTPARAWKLKKPVSYDHTDFSDLSARRDDCIAEVRLNRALAPGVYLGVEALTADAHGVLALGGAGRPVDYLVCMRRMPRARCLEHCLASGTVDAAGVDGAATVLARFYRDTRSRGAVEPRAIAAAMEAEADELARLPLGRDAPVAHLHGLLQRSLARESGRLAARPRRDVHGDLRPQHVYLGDPPVFLDRITVPAGLRLMDPAEELAFLALDCDRLGDARVGARFLEVYARVTGDRPPASVVRFYRGRRALLWSLLSARHLLRGGPERYWRGVARDYLRLGLAGGD